MNYENNLHIFSERIISRMKKENLITKKGKPDVIALYNKLYPNDKITDELIKQDRQKVTDKTRSVSDWIKGKYYPRSIKDIMDLCNILNCSMDYLFDYNECSQHDIHFVHDYTGLSEETIDKLSDRISREWVCGALDKLIPMQTFRYVLFHIFEYIKERSRLKNIGPDYDVELIISYSDKNCGNYLGEGKFEKEYHELEDKIEHQEFQINKWFIQTISSIRDSIEKSPDTN